jgi:hypothetical protein
MPFPRFTKLALACTLPVAFCGVAFAQSTTQGGIAGTVEDTTEAVIPNATVVIRNLGTNAEQHLNADASGFFKAPLLEPGSYEVSITVPGFGTYDAANVIVQVGRLTTLMPRLAAGSSTETVSVSADATQLNFDSPDLNSLLNSAAIDNIPVQNRRWSSLALTTPGVVADSSGFGLVSMHGMSTLLNNVLIDGADDNNAFYSEERGRTREAYSTSENAVLEFQVNSGVYSAQFGRAVGGVINSVTKSGTNNIHGTALFDDLDRGFGAIAPGSTIVNSTGQLVPLKPKDLRKIYGFSAGGPLIKDKLFWFYTYDQQTRINPGIAKAGTPTTFNLTPDTAAPAGSVCNTATGYMTGASALDQQACTLAAREGLGSYAAGATAYITGLAGLNSDLGVVPRTGYQEINTPKLDYQINPKERISLLYHRLRWDAPGDVQTASSASYARDTFGNDFVKLDYGVAKLESNISGSVTNELLYQYSRELLDETQQPFTPYTTANLAGNNGNIPQVGVDGATGFTLGSPYYSYRLALPDERKWQIGDTLYYQLRNHSIRAGVDILHNDDLQNNTYESNGAYSYTYIGNLLADLASKGKASTCNTAGSSAATATVSAVGTSGCYATFFQGFGNPLFEVATLDYGFFLQDNWKATPRLTLELGLRYDYESLPNPNAAYTAAVPATSTTTGYTPYPGLTNRPSDKNNFGPRIGFAYDVYGHGNTVLRGGYGMYYGRILNGTILNTYLNTGSPNGQFTTPTIRPTTAGAPVFPNIIASAAGSTPTSNFLAQNLQNPMTHEFDLQLQQNLGKGTIFQVGYLGSLGRTLPNFLNVNLNPVTTPVTITVADTTGKGPLPNGATYVVPTYTSYLNKNFGAITEVISNINSSYNGLTFEIQNHTIHNLQFDANYTWSHALDFNQNATTGTTTNNWLDPYASPRSNYGISNFNVGNRFVGYVLYTIPGVHSGSELRYLTNGWSISDTFQMQNGLPYSASLQSSFNSASALNSYWNGAGGVSYIPVIGRNTLTVPRAIVNDNRLQKEFAVTERYRLQLRADVYNVANHSNYNTGNINTNSYTLSSTGSTSSTLTYLPAFNTRSSANTSGFLYTPREIQIGARFQF